MTVDELKGAYKDKKIKLIRKDKSRWMKVWAWFVGLFGVKDYMTRYWTSAFGNVYYPTWETETPGDSFFSRNKATLLHELEHVKQKERYTLIGQAMLYALLPVPILFAYFRWKFEREAYMHNIRAGRSVDQAVDSLWSVAYLWPWPKPWMRKWFEKQIRKESVI